LLSKQEVEDLSPDGSTPDLRLLLCPCQVISLSAEEVEDLKPRQLPRSSTSSMPW